MSLLTVAVLSACTPSGDLDIENAALSDISVEDAAAATVKSMSIEGAVEATLQAMAPDATDPQVDGVFDSFEELRNYVRDRGWDKS